MVQISKIDQNFIKMQKSVQGEEYSLIWPNTNNNTAYESFPPKEVQIRWLEGKKTWKKGNT